MPKNDGWYIAEGEEPKGPFKFDHLEEQVRTGKLNPTDLVYHKNTGWKEVRSIHDLEDIYKQILSQSASRSDKPAAVDTSRLAKNKKPAFKNRRLMVAVVLIAAVMVIGLLKFVQVQGKSKTSARRAKRKQALSISKEPKILSNKDMIAAPKEKLEESLQTLMKKDQIGDGNSAVKGKIGHVYSKLDRYDSAIAYLEDAVKLEPDNPLYREILAESYLRIGALEKAHDHIDAALRLDPTSEEALFLNGAIYYEMGRYEEVVTMLAKLSDPEKDPKAHYYLGMANFQLSHPDSAIVYLEKYLPYNSEDPEANITYVEAMSQLGKIAELREIYARKIAESPESYIFHYVCAIITDDLIESLDHLKRSVDFKDDFTPAYRALVSRLLTMQQYVDAGQMFEKLEAQEPVSADMLLLKARVQYGKEEFSEAVATAEKAAMLYKGENKQEFYCRVNLLIVNAFIERNQVADAKRYIILCSDQAQENTQAWLRFQISRNKIARLEERFKTAANILDKAKSKAAKYPELAQKISVEMGLTYLEAGQMDRAINHFNSVLGKKNAVPTYFIAAGFWKGISLIYKNDRTGAKTIWQTIADKFPAEKYPSTTELICIEYLTGRIGFDTLSQRFKNEPRLRRALIAFCVGFREQMEGNLISGQKFYNMALAYLKERKNPPCYLIQHSMQDLGKSLIIPQ